jgi:drug/metabolite transporter (DMT)-like permease
MATTTAIPAAAARPDAARREREGVALSVVAAAGFAAMVVMAKLAYAGGANVVTLLAVRFAIAAVLLWALAARRGVVRGVVRRDALLALALGLLVYSVEAGLLFTSLTRIDASLAELLIFSYPAIVVLGAIALRHEPASRRRLAALAVAMSGIVLVLAGSGAAGALDPVGVAAALCAAVLYATYVLIAGRIGGRLHALTFAALVSTGTALGLTLAGLTSGSLDLAMSAAAWGWMLAITLGSTVIALTAFLGGVARLGPGRASILAMLEPPIACLLAFIVFGERLTPLQLAGGALVLAAALVLQLRPLRSLRRGTSAVSPARTATRTVSRVAARRRRLGVRAEVGRLPRPRVRRRGRDRDSVARR